MKPNIVMYYYTEDYVSGRLLQDGKIKTVNLKAIKLNTYEAKQLAGILESNISNEGHRCIAVYRDAFTVEGDTYNVCLSCGDFYKNDQHFYLSDKGIAEFSDFKQMLIDTFK